MKKITYIIFRYLTSADIFNIYKPTGTEIGGGGQSYIDLPTKTVPVESWGEFFENATSVFCDTREQGPSWDFPIHSIGLASTRELKVYQRRPQSVCISSQRITSQQENRVDAWRPENGFPSPSNSHDRSADPEGLLVFLVRTLDNEFWAGWSQSSAPFVDPALKDMLSDMFNPNKEEGYAGFIRVRGDLFLDTNSKERPFRSHL